MSEPTNTTAPPRKRRRPALSCEQCRRRKIKCDRAYPCGQCLQSKTTTCTYSPDTVRRPHHVTHTSARPAQTSLGLPDRSRDIPAGISTQGSSPRVSPNPITSSEATAPSSWTSPSVAGFEVATTPKTILQGTETAGNNLSELHSFFPTCESWNHTGKSTKGLRGTVSKTRLFGPSHWMHSYGVVRASLHGC